MGAILIGMLVGAAVIIQGGLNREISRELNITYATVFNNLIILIPTFILLFMAWMPNSPLPEFFKGKPESYHFQWWHLVPGFMGFIIVAGLPYGFYKFGAFKVVLTLVVSQVIFSLVWDFFRDGVVPSSTKIAGMVLGVIGVVLANLK